MDTDAKKDAPEAAPEADVVTQIQDHIALICSRFYNFIGALQRDAPPAPLHGEVVPDQRHERLQDEIKIMRKEVTESLTSLETLIQQLPDLSSSPEKKQWQEAAALEAAGEEEAATLEKELQLAKQKLESLYSAHGALADTALR